MVEDKGTVGGVQTGATDADHVAESIDGLHDPPSFCSAPRGSFMTDAALLPSFSNLVIVKTFTKSSYTGGVNAGLLYL